jgi:hypothetical protein
MTALTFDHFAQVEEALCGYYGRTANALGCTFAYQALMEAAPSITQELWDLGVAKALANSRWKPSLSDVLCTIYERSTEGLPPLPDIDPRFADGYQQNTYWRAVDARRKLLESAPVDPRRIKQEVAAELKRKGAALPQGVVTAREQEARELEARITRPSSNRPEAQVFRAPRPGDQSPQNGQAVAQGNGLAQLAGW